MRIRYVGFIIEMHFFFADALMFLLVYCSTRSKPDILSCSHCEQHCLKKARLLNTRVFVFVTAHLYLYLYLYLCLYLLESNGILSESRDMYLLFYLYLYLLESLYLTT